MPPLGSGSGVSHVRIYRKPVRSRPLHEFALPAQKKRLRSQKVELAPGRMRFCFFRPSTFEFTPGRSLVSKIIFAPRGELKGATVLLVLCAEQYPRFYIRAHSFVQALGSVDFEYCTQSKWAKLFLGEEIVRGCISKGNSLLSREFLSFWGKI